MPENVPWIAVVDDNAANRYTVSRYLRLAGFAVKEGALGRDAFTLAEQDPEVMILDVQLPDMSGFDVCRRLKAQAHTRHVPIIHTSATFVTSDAQVQGLEGGADAYLTAPFEYPVLVSTIKALLRLKAAELEARNAEERTALNLLDMKQLHEATLKVARAKKSSEALREILEAAVTAAGTDKGFLYLKSKHSVMLELAASKGFSEEILSRAQSLPPGGGVCGSAYQRRERVIVENIAEHPLAEEWADVPKQAGFQSCHSVPLIGRNLDVRGVISVHFSERHRADEREMRLLDLYAQMAADLIERMQVEEDFRESQRRQVKTLSLMSVGVYTCDREGRITFFNRCATELWDGEPEPDDRFTPGGKIYQTNGELLPPDQTPMAIAMRTGRSFRELELVVERRDGERFFASFNVEVLRDSHEEVTGTVIVFQDISDRKRHEEVLLQLSKKIETQAKLFDATLSNITDLTYAFGSDGRFLYANRPLLQMLGRPLEDVVGKNLLELGYPPEHAEKLLDDMGKVFSTGQSVEGEIFIKLGPGQREIHQYIYNPVKDEEGRVVAMAGSTRIVTNRRREEERVRLLAGLTEKIDRCTTSAEVIQIALETVGAYLDVQRCRFTEWDMDSDRVFAMHEWHVPTLPELTRPEDLALYGPPGWFAELASGESAVSDVEAQEPFAPFRENYRKNQVRAFANSRHVRQNKGVVALFVTSDTPRTWTPDDVRLLNEVVAHIWPSVERMRSLDALVSSEQRYRELVQSMPVAVCTCDVNGKVRLYNAAAEKLWGRKLSEDTDYFWCGSETMLTSDEQPIRHDEGPLAKVFREQSSPSWEIVIRRPNGELRYVIANPRLTRDADGRVTGAINVMVDITERKRDEQRSAFLHELSKQTSLLDDENEIIRASTTALGLALRANRCYFAECHLDKDQVVVSENWRSDSQIPNLAGEYTLSDFGGREWWAAMVGGNFHVDDVDAHELTRDRARSFHQLGVRSYLVQPYREKRRWQTLLAVTSSQPREWTEEELMLVDDVASRIWPMVQRARAVSALRRSETDLRFALEAARLGSWDWNIETGVLRSSERCKANFGLPPHADFVDGDYTQSIVKDDRDKVQRTIEEAIKHHTVYETEYRVVWPDGKIHWILERGQGIYDESGKASRVIGLNLDITQRKDNEEAMLRTAERLQLALDAAKLGIWNWELSSDHIEISPRMGEIMGVDPATKNLSRAVLREMLHPDDRERSRLANERAIKFGTDYDEEYRLIHRNGSMAWIASKGRLIYDADRRPIGMLGVIQDITARKHVEDYLRQQRDILELVLKSTSLAEILKSLTQQIESLVDRRLVAGILLMDANSRTLRPVAGASVPVEWSRYIDFLVPGPESGSMGVAAFTERPVVVSDIATSPLWKTLGAEALKHGFKACWSVPIIASEGGLLGVFAIYYFEVTEPTSHELEILDIVTRTSSIAIERRRNEAAVRSSEERLRLATATGKVGVWDWDVTNNYLAWSDSVYKIHGVSREDFDGTIEGFTRLVHADDREAFSKAMETSMATGEPFEIEFRATRSDGEIIWLFTNANVLRENGVAVRVTGATLDITERRRAEEALRTKEQQLSLVTGSAPILLTQCDVDERFTFANRAYLEKRGLSSSQVVGRRISEVLDEKSYHAIKPYINRVLTGERVVFEVNIVYQGEVRAVEASYVPEVDASGQVKGWVAAVTDITERKRVHDAVRQLAAIVESSDDAIISRTLEGKIVSWNKGAERLFGYHASEAMGQSVVMLMPPERRNDESQIIGKIRNGISVDHYETVRMRKDGVRVDVSLMISPIRDEHGRIIGASKIARDITQQKRYEAQLKAAQEQLQAYAQNLEQKVEERTAALREAVTQMEEFSYTVSHDLRAPLRAMNSYSQALLEDYAARLDDTGKEYLYRIQRSSQRMEQLTHDVLMYSRLVRSEVVLVDLNLEEMVIDVVDQYEELQSPRAEIEIVSPLGHAVGHEVSLGQCLANLLTNAVKFVAPGVKPRIRIYSETIGARLRLWVQDNGIGIAPEHQAKIFLIFERLHGREQYEGTGMGLAIVRKAMEKMGGACGVESNGVDGSRFWLELPKAANPQ